MTTTACSAPCRSTMCWTTCCRKAGATPIGPRRMAESRARLDQPRVERRGARVLRFDPEAFGQWTEKFARFLGTGRYLVVQTAVIALWVIDNTIPGLPHP